MTLLSTHRTALQCWCTFATIQRKYYHWRRSKTWGECFQYTADWNLACESRAYLGSHESRPHLEPSVSYTMSGWPSDVPEDLNPYYWRDYELGVEEGCWSPRVVIPKQFDQPIYMYLFLTLCLQAFSWHSKASQQIHPYGYCLVCWYTYIMRQTFWFEC